MSYTLICLLLGASLLWLSQSWRASAFRPLASSSGTARPLQPLQVNPSWTLSGTPNYRGVETSRSPDGRSVHGLWAGDGPSTFRWTFDLDETVHVLEGQVQVDYRGHRFSLNPGDVAHFRAGTQAVWHVPQYLKKAYVLHDPGRLVRWWRQHVTAELR